MPIALITGASAGIGQATARLLGKSGYDLIICGRRQERLDALKDELSGDCALHTLCFDVRDKEAVAEKISSLSGKWKEIDLLINNAGNAHGLDTVQDADLDDWDAMIDINVKGLLYVSKAVLSGMVERRSGHIINIGSTAGKEVYPKGNVYCASKHAVDAITQGMRLDLNTIGIKVTAINPGLVETEFSEVRFKGDQDKAQKVYAGMTPLRPEDVAETILFAATRPPHVNIADLILMPTDQASSTVVKRNS